MVIPQIDHKKVMLNALQETADLMSELSGNDVVVEYNELVISIGEQDMFRFFWSQMPLGYLSKKLDLGIILPCAS